MFLKVVRSTAAVGSFLRDDVLRKLNAVQFQLTSWVGGVVVRTHGAPARG